MGRAWRAAVLLFGLTSVAVNGGCVGRQYGWDEDDNAAGRRSVAQPEDKGASRRDAEALRWAACRHAEARAWAQRDRREQLERAIALQQQLLEAAGGRDRALLVKLARAHYLLGLECTDREAKIRAFEEGMRYGDKALYTFDDFRVRLERGAAPHEAVQALGRQAVGAIYWDAVNIAKWSRAKGMLKVLTWKDRARAMIERVLALDPAYYHGAADRYLGAYYAALPGFAGRDLERSRRHFERSLQIAPSYLFTRVLMARYLAVALDDRALYARLLQQVLAADPDEPKEIAPEQRLAQREAARMLATIDDRFDVEEGGETDGAPATSEAEAKGEASR